MSCAPALAPSLKLGRRNGRVLRPLRPPKPATAKSIGFRSPAAAGAGPCRVEDLPAARWPAAGCSGRFCYFARRAISASRWPGSADSSTATQGASAPAKVSTDTEHHRGPFEGVRLCAFHRQFTAVRTVAVGDRVGAIGAYSCGKDGGRPRARATAPATYWGWPFGAELR
jgi:hypothetical protein